MVFVTAGGSVRPIIRTFAASGRLLGSHVWDKGHIVGWGWSGTLELVIVDDVGKVSVLSIFGERVREFSMGAAVEKAGVAEVSLPLGMALFPETYLYLFVHLIPL